MGIKDIKKDVEDRMHKAVESMRREFMEVRTGRAHPGLIEGMHIDYYGTPTMIKQVAAISVPDPKTIVIQPWDPSAIVEIEKVIMNSKLGVTPNNDGKVIRLSVPPLSTERREEMKKVVKEMAEHGRISLRTIRRDANDKIKKMETEHLVSEDESTRGHEEIQKMTDKFIKEIDDILSLKNKDLVEF